MASVLRHQAVQSLCRQAWLCDNEFITYNNLAYVKPTVIPDKQHYVCSENNIIQYRPWGGDALRLGMQPYVWRRTGHASQTQWSIHLRREWPREGDEHHAYVPERHGTLVNQFVVSTRPSPGTIPGCSGRVWTLRTSFPTAAAFLQLSGSYLGMHD